MVQAVTVDRLCFSSLCKNWQVIPNLGIRGKLDGFGDFKFKIARWTPDKKGL
jgi:hypothetical protein